MTGLTPDQITFGSKARMTPLPPPAPDRAGRWICHQCPWPRWTRGTYQQWLDHYKNDHLEDA